MEFGELFVLALGIAIISMCNAYSVVTTKPLEVAEEDLDGAMLIDMATRTNTTLLEIVGHAIANLEKEIERKWCESIPCSEWSDWSKCSATTSDTFGTQTRTRNCSYGTPETCAIPLPGEAQVKTESEEQFCPGGLVSDEKTTKTTPKAGIVPCPEPYITSIHGYCVQFINEKLARDEAEEKCQQDEGHLMNMDTEQRWKDFCALSDEYNMSSKTLWIDGKCEKLGGTVEGGDWSYESGTEPANNGVDQWSFGYPDNNFSNVCKTTFMGKWRSDGCYLDAFKQRYRPMKQAVCEMRRDIH